MTENESRCIPKKEYNGGDYFHAYQAGYDDGVKNSGQEVKIIHYSLSDREYFAAMAMQGYISAGSTGMPDVENIVKYSVIASDKLIEELNKPIKG